MIRLGKKSRKNSSQVLEEAIAYFGPDGVGLQVTRQDDGGVYLEGGGGFIAVTVWPQEDGKRTEVEIESHEWDHQAEGFLTRI